MVRGQPPLTERDRASDRRLPGACDRRAWCRGRRGACAAAAKLDASAADLASRRGPTAGRHGRRGLSTASRVLMGGLQPLRGDQEGQVPCCRVCSGNRSAAAHLQPGCSAASSDRSSVTAARPCRRQPTASRRGCLPRSMRARSSLLCERVGPVRESSERSSGTVACVYVDLLGRL